jgi:hypothetical protein
MPPRLPPVVSSLGADVTFLEISNQGVHPAEFEIAPEDQPGLFSLILHDGNIAVRAGGAADPKAFASG